MDQKQNMDWFRKNLPQKSPDQFKVLILPGALAQSFLTNCGPKIQDWRGSLEASDLLMKETKAQLHKLVERGTGTRM